MKLAVFDLDGTLVDSHPAIVGCFGDCFARCGLPPVDEGAVTSLIGLPLLQMFDLLLPDESAERRAEAVRVFSTGYPRFDRELSRPFAGVLDVVRDLRGRRIRTAIATSKSRVGLDRVCHELDLGSLFDVRLSNDDVVRKKPDPEMLLVACDRSGVDPVDAVMIGDTTYDVAMGVGAGSWAVGVTWGAHDGPRLLAAGAHHVVHAPAELSAVSCQLSAVRKQLADR